MITLRPMTEKDLPLTLAWRSIPKVYAGLYTQSHENRPLKWEEHQRWFKTRDTWQLFIIMYDGWDSDSNRPVGWLNIGQLDHWRPEIGIGIGEVGLWGKGIAKQALNLALDWLKDGEYNYTHTTILDNNTASIKLFESVGYKKIGPARPGESWYYLPLEERKR